MPVVWPGKNNGPSGIWKKDIVDRAGSWTGCVVDDGEARNTGATATKEATEEEEEFSEAYGDAEVKDKYEE